MLSCPSDITAALASSQHEPVLYNLKRTYHPKLGQHFLSDEGYRRRIIEALDLRPDELVLEIGPGRGAMTYLLAERARHVVAIELDTKLAASLCEQTREQPKITILEADILATDIADLCRHGDSTKCFVFGNLPYYITSPIIHHLFRFADAIQSMALLVQREVADRLTASPGSRAYGYLSVLTQLHSEPRLALDVPPGAFSPHPKVQSALTVFRMRDKLAEKAILPGTAHIRCGAEREQFLNFVKQCFEHKRKNLVNNLAPTCSRRGVANTLTSLGLPPTIRAEQLTIGQFAKLFEALR